MSIKVSKIIYCLESEELVLSKTINNDVQINKIQIDSRSIQKGDIFVAIKGYKSDGHLYIQDVINKGASLVIGTESSDGYKNLNYVQVKDARKAGALIAHELAGKPSNKIKIIGITGTNGKTTTATIVSDLLNKVGVKCGFIGTIGYSYGDKEITSERTTPDFIELNEILADMVSAGCEAVVMEVSSHALALQRVFGIKFEIVAFTNLTQDHLDFHHDFESYYQAKKILFDWAAEHNIKAIFNSNDEFGKRYYREFKREQKLLYGYSIDSDYLITDVSIKPNGTEFILNGIGFNSEISTNYIGEFNVLNVTLATIIVRNLYPERRIDVSIFKELKKTPGRLEIVKNRMKRHAIVDYAHTPDAVVKVLLSMRKLTNHRIITVIGCGGNRDRTKRPIMAKNAVLYSDVVIFTDDNPRYEDNTNIIADMVRNIKTGKYIICRDRKKAIESALTLAKCDDVVVVLGKGHESYQEINGTKHHFSDQEVIRNFVPEIDNNGLSKTAIPYDVMNLIVANENINNSKLADKIAEIPNFVIDNLVSDSRKVRSNSLFFAFKGDNHDGNDFIEEILAKDKSVFALGERKYIHPRYLQVKNTVEFYGYIAKKYLELFNVEKIAITGSTGKTTTKEIMKNILSESYSVLSTYGNENNFIGLPRTIFRIKPQDSYAIFEIGSNNVGEIEYLADIINPDYAIVTSVDSSHLENFKDLAGVYREKSSLIKRRLKSFVFPGDNELFHEFKVGAYKGTAYSVGNDTDNSYTYKVDDISSEKMHLKLNNSTYEVNSIIPYYARNYAYAIALAKIMNVNSNSIICGLRRKIEVGNRMNIVKDDKRTLIIDCYNANPVSTKAAINFWKSYCPNERHIAIIGDMLELGEDSQILHKELNNHLMDIENSIIYTVGNETKVIKSTASFANVEELIESKILKTFNSGIILIKGSHGNRLEKVVEVIV